MKKIFYSILFAIAAVSCREQGDYFLNPNDPMATEYFTYTEQFEVVWNAINSGYCLWDVTDVDWDARYKEYKPKFEALDREYNASGTTADKETYQKLYQGLTEGLKDYFMQVKLKDPVGGNTISFKPCMTELHSRPYYHDLDPASFYFDFFVNNTLLPTKDVDIAEIQVPEAGDGYIASGSYELEDGRIIPYVWLTSIESIKKIRKYVENNQQSQDEKVQKNIADLKKYLYRYDYFNDLVVNTPKEKLAGVIVDLRENVGGNSEAVNDYSGMFIDENLTVFEARYKEGMGRYEMSAWMSFPIYPTQKHRNMAAENIPVVTLCDANTIGGAEYTTYAISQIPTGHVIGERTIGAIGGVMLDENFSYFSSGSVGDSDLESMKHYIRASNMETRTLGGPNFAGIGLTPDKEVLYKEAGYDGQFREAVQYIKAYK